MGSESYLRPRTDVPIEAASQFIAQRVAADVAHIQHVLEQESFYLRSYARLTPDGLEIDTENVVRWIAERLRYKRNKVRSILDAYCEYLREKGLTPPMVPT